MVRTPGRADVGGGMGVTESDHPLIGPIVAVSSLSGNLTPREYPLALAIAVNRVQNQVTDG